MSNSNKIFESRTCRHRYAAGALQFRVSRSRFLTAFLICACGFMFSACRGSQGPTSNTGSADNRKTAFTTPPFSTKEPDRYQAIRITSVIETGNTGNLSSSQSTQVLIARDGEKRREEYSAGANGQIVYLEIPAGRFIVLPANRLYADLSKVSEETDPISRPEHSSNDSPGLSPDQLLNEAHAPATYENLGAETLAGRLTTKYRVVVLTGTGSENENETQIWIDEALGMPVRSEAMSKSGGHSSKVTMELKDLKLEVDERLFSWPSDYKKAEAQQIFDLIRKRGKPGTSKQQDK